MNFSIFSLHAPGPRAFSQTSSSTFPNCRKRKAAAEPVAPAPTIKMRCIASGCQAKDCESLNQWQHMTTLNHLDSFLANFKQSEKNGTPFSLSCARAILQYSLNTACLQWSSSKHTKVKIFVASMASCFMLLWCLTLLHRFPGKDAFIIVAFCLVPFRLQKLG